VKFSKKFFVVLGLVALLASLFVTGASAEGIKADVTALQVDQYAVASGPSLITLKFVGAMPCSGIVLPASEVEGRDIYITIQTLKNVQSWMCVPQKTFTKSFSFTNLKPGARYAVHINPGSNVKGIKLFWFVVPKPFKP
jgi:hypothetical protein